ncbi:hypothetical protein AB0N87_37665 [Streptomyces sp. NPDC093228]|nr:MULTISPECIES: hypothetical protein [unclassified Streptomyces]MDX3262039.1 hypothetical protein [Streptomyces sp. MI02-2A]
MELRGRSVVRLCTECGYPLAALDHTSKLLILLCVLTAGILRD